MVSLSLSDMFLGQSLAEGVAASSPRQTYSDRQHVAPDSMHLDDKSRSALAVAGLILEERKDLAQRFRKLVSEWYAERDTLSSNPRDLAMCLSYQKIIAMGPPAIPLILAELRRSTDHWFWALHALTDSDPVPEECYGRMSKMAEFWIEWGIAHEYISRQASQRLPKSQ
jgi:hypothetical protein